MMPRLEDTMRMASLRGLAGGAVTLGKSSDAALKQYGTQLRTAIEELTVELLRTDDHDAQRTIRQMRTRFEQTASAVERTRSDLEALLVTCKDLEFRASASLIVLAMEGRIDENE
jgi:hypothetical protein